MRIEWRMPWFSDLTVERDDGETEAGNTASGGCHPATNHQHPDNDTDQWPQTESKK